MNLPGRAILVCAAALAAACKPQPRSGPLVYQADSLFPAALPDSCLKLSGSGYRLQPPPTTPIRPCAAVHGDTSREIAVDAHGLVLEVAWGINGRTGTIRDSLYSFQFHTLSGLFGIGTSCPQSDDLSVTDDVYWPTPFGHVRIAKRAPSMFFVTSELGPGGCHGGA